MASDQQKALLVKTKLQADNTSDVRVLNQALKEGWRIVKEIPFTPVPGAAGGEFPMSETSWVAVLLILQRFDDADDDSCA